MDSKEICFRMLRVDSERKVTEIVSSIPELSCPDNWHPMDGRDTNFNVVTNQASIGSKALTELCTNMVDAVLLKYAHEKGIDVTGPYAPRSVIDGVRDLIQLEGTRSGILAEVDDAKYLQEFAEQNLIIGVTGGTRKKDSLCFTFVDNGEGQHPEMFEDTFLSLSKGNKSKISFVQGKYNMGSSGVLSYCGKHWYKLIISRRYDDSGDWGWTLVRRRPGDGMPVAEYFKLATGIPCFAVQDIYPMLLQSDIEDEKVHIKAGTIIKLYDYQMESATNFRYIRESLEQNLISTILPFRLMDYRFKPDPNRTGRRAQGVDERRLYGMEFLLLRTYVEETSQFDDDELDREPGSEQHIGEVNHPELGSISIRGIILKKDLPGWLQPHRNPSRVFHAVNGQVQYKENRAYLSRQCKLPGLKDRIVIIVDASELSEAAHNDVWKGDRENIRATSVGKTYRDEITNVIANSQFLKQLQNRLAREETESLAEQGKTELFQDLVNNDPSIAQLLPGGSRVKLPGYIGRGEEEPEPWRGKYSPTFLKLVGRSIRNNGAEIAIDGSRRVFFETDVVNDYVTRPDNRGRIFDIGNLKGKCSYVSNLRDGKLTVTFRALEDQLEPGERIEFSMALQDDAMPEPVTDQLTLVVVEVRTPIKPRDTTEVGKRDVELETGEGRSLPPSKWFTKDGRMIGDEETDRWPGDFTDQDGGVVKDLGETLIYYINYDNAHFRHFLDRTRNEIDKKVITAQYRIGMLVLMMGIEDAYNRMEESRGKTGIMEYIDDIRRLSARGSATVVMSIAKTLPTIINPASMADPDDS